MKIDPLLAFFSGVGVSLVGALVANVLTAGGAYMASCAMCAGLGATIPGCLSSSPVPINNLTLHPAKMPDSLRCTFTLYTGMVSFCRISKFLDYRKAQSNVPPLTIPWGVRLQY